MKPPFLTMNMPFLLIVVIIAVEQAHNADMLSHFIMSHQTCALLCRPLVFSVPVDTGRLWNWSVSSYFALEPARLLIASFSLHFFSVYLIHAWCTDICDSFRSQMSSLQYYISNCILHNEMLFLGCSIYL